MTVVRRQSTASPNAATPESRAIAGPGRRHLRRFLDRRIPRARQVTLDQRRIFIAPSRAGLWFLLALVLMFLVAVNYQNNMAFGLVFLLFSLLVVSILHTYGNLAGLVLDGVRGHPTFAGERAAFEVQLSCPPSIRDRSARVETAQTAARHRHNLTVRWPQQASATVSLVDSRASTVRLFHETQRRGVLRPGRLLLESAYPLGLIRAWTWVDLDLTALVYPQPIACPKPMSADQETDPEGSRQWQPGSDDFAGFRAYRAGDNPRHVFWRGAAKGLPLQSKSFADTQLPTELLAWEAVSGDPEQRLGKLCYWVLESARQQQPFGLALPGITLAPAAGVEQRDRALQALACFGGRELVQ